MNRPGADTMPLREALLDELLDLVPEQRAARLAELARVRPDDADEIRRWLDDIDRSEGFLEAGPDAAARHWRPQPDASIDAWRLTRPLGAGGMGEVWLAERADGAFEKRVAIKFLRSDTPVLRDRLRHERRVLARLEHPGIARLLDGGVAPDGSPYLITEYIEGRTLDDWCGAGQPDLATRLAVFRAVAAAVSYAHANLVVHRDLKPANVIIDSAVRPRLLDFGIAKLLDAGGANTAERSLTPQFAAPEQLTGAAVTTATDVYALGALLYTLLTGAPPLDTANLPLAALARRVCEEIPPAASTRATLAQVPAAALRGDYDAILARALAKSPAERYPSVDALIADLDNAAAILPVAARRAGRRYHALRFVRRHRAAIGIAALLLLALLGGLAGTLWQARIAQQQRGLAEAQRDEARREARRSQGIIDFLLAMLGRAAPNGEAVRVGDLLASANDRLLTDATATPEVRATIVGVLADIYAQRRDPAGIERMLRPLLEREAGQLPDTVAAHAACDLAQALRELGRVADAQRWVDIGLARSAAPQGDAARARATCLSQAALVADANGHLDRALDLHRQALAQADPDNRADDDLAAIVHGNLAVSLYRADRLLAARREHERALSILRGNGRGETADAASEMADLAIVDRAVGLLAQADVHLGEANALRQRVSGPSAGLAQQLINAASMKTDLGQPQAALDLLDRADAMLRDFVTPESMHVAMLAEQRGNAFAALGRRTEARAQFARTREIFARLLPPDSSFHDGLRMYEAEMLMQPGGSDTAEPRIALAALANIERDMRSGGSSHLMQLPKVLLLEAEAAERIGDADLAAVKAAAARSAYARDSDPDGWQIAASDVILAVARHGGDPAAARTLLAGAVLRLERSLGGDHPRTRAARTLLATLP